MYLIIAEIGILILVVAGFLGYRQYRLNVHRQSRGEVHTLRGRLQVSDGVLALLVADHPELQSEIDALRSMCDEAAKPNR